MFSEIYIFKKNIRDLEKSKKDYRAHKMSPLRIALHFQNIYIPIPGLKNYMIKRNLKKFKTRTKNKLLIAFDYYSNEQI